MLDLFNAMVTLTFSSFNTSLSGEGRKSLITFNFPIGSSVYFILLFIYLPPFSPISSSVNADNIASISKPHGHDAIAYLTDTVKSVFLSAVIYIFYNDTMRVKKGMLGQ